MDGVFELAFLPICTILYLAIAASTIFQLLLLLKKGEIIFFPSVDELKPKGPLTHQILSIAPVAAPGFAGIWFLMKVNQYLTFLNWISFLQAMFCILISIICFQVAKSRVQQLLAFFLVILPYSAIILTYIFIDIERLKPILVALSAFITGGPLFLLTATLVKYRKNTSVYIP